METVSFTRMADGTRQDYELLARHEQREHADLVDRLLAMMQTMDGDVGYQVSRLQHSLQSATRAHRDGKDEEYVVSCLLHDIGDVLAPFNHSRLAAAVLRPYVSEKMHWMVSHHGIFQGYYYFHHLGQDRNARDAFRDHPWFEDCVEFCERYDQNCFDPGYDTLPLEFFEPMVRRVFASPREHMV